MLTTVKLLNNLMGFPTVIGTSHRGRLTAENLPEKPLLDYPCFTLIKISNKL